MCWRSWMKLLYFKKVHHLMNDGGQCKHVAGKAALVVQLLWGSPNEAAWVGKPDVLASHNNFAQTDVSHFDRAVQSYKHVGRFQVKVGKTVSVEIAQCSDNANQSLLSPARRSKFVLWTSMSSKAEIEHSCQGQAGSQWDGEYWYLVLGKSSRPTRLPSICCCKGFVLQAPALIPRLWKLPVACLFLVENYFLDIWNPTCYSIDRSGFFAEDGKGYEGCHTRSLQVHKP